MKTRELRHYPEALKQASCYMLYNEKLMNTFCNVLYKKTNLDDHDLIFKSFDLIDSWMDCLKQRKKMIPLNFDHYGLMKGVSMVLEKDDSISVAKAIWFVYKNFFMFPDIIVHEFHEYLFGKVFVKLFLHWSFTVRMIFHRLIWFRIYHKHKRLI